MKAQFRRIIVMGISLLAVGLPLASNAVPAQAAGKFIVDDNLACPGANYATIQDAVSHAGSGPAAITVCAGTYLGLVNIASAKNISLTAKPGVTLAPNFGPYNLPLIEVTGSTNITITGFTLDGQNSLATNGPVAIQFTNSTGAIQKNKILNWHAPTFPTSRIASDIVITGSKNQTVKVTSNNLPGIDGYGIYCATSKLIASKNTISAVSTATNGAKGIYLFGATGGSVTGNTIVADAFPGLGTFTGIYGDSLNTSTISTNTITGALNGIWMTDDGVKANKNTITGNKINQAEVGIMVFSYASAANGAANFDKIMSNKIVDTSSNPGNSGIILFADGTGANIAQMKNVTARQNKIVHFTIGLEHNTGPNGIMSGVFAPNTIIP